MLNNDVYYSIYDGGKFYQSASSMTTYLGYIHPDVPLQSGNHSNLIISMPTTGNSLESFTFSYTTSPASALSGLYVQWQSIGGWCNANISYNTAGGCGLIDGQVGTSTTINIKSSNLLALTASDTIYLNIQLSQGANIPTNTVQISTSTTDSIGTPTITGSNFTAPLTSSYVYMSGIPYYSSNSILTFPQNSLYFKNIYNQVDPKLLSFKNNIVQFTDTSAVLSTSCNYTSLFTSTSLNQSNSYPINLNLTGISTTVSPYILQLNSVLYNSQNINGVTNPYIYMGFANSNLYDNINYTTLVNTTTTTGGFGTFTINRYSVTVSNISLSSSQNIILSSNYNFGYNISADDMFYSPCDNAFYQNISNMPIKKGTYSTYTNIITPLTAYNPIVNIANGTIISSSSHSYICFKLNMSSSKSFAINMPSSVAQYVSNIFIQWSDAVNFDNGASYPNGRSFYTATLANGSPPSSSQDPYGCFKSSLYTSWKTNLSLNTKVAVIYPSVNGSIPNGFNFQNFIIVLYCNFVNANIPLDNIWFSTT